MIISKTDKSETNHPIFNHYNKINRRNGHYHDFEYVMTYTHVIHTNKRPKELISVYNDLMNIALLRNPYVGLEFIANKKSVMEFFKDIHKQTNLYIFNLDFSQYILHFNGKITIYVKAELCKCKNEGAMTFLPKHLEEQSARNELRYYLELKDPKSKVKDLEKIFEKIIQTNEDYDNIKPLSMKTKKKKVTDGFVDEQLYNKINQVDSLKKEKNKIKKKIDKGEHTEEMIDKLFQKMIEKNHYELTLANLTTFNQEKIKLLQNYMNQNIEKGNKTDLMTFIYKEHNLLKQSELLLKDSLDKKVEIVVQQKTEGSKKSSWSFKGIFSKKKQDDNIVKQEKDIDVLYDKMVKMVFDWSNHLSLFHEVQHTSLENELKRLQEKVILLLRTDMNAFSISYIFYLDECFTKIFNKVKHLGLNLKGIEQDIMNEIITKVHDLEEKIISLNKELIDVTVINENEHKEVYLNDFKNTLKDL